MFQTYDEAIEKLEISPMVSTEDYNRIKYFVCRQKFVNKQEMCSYIVSHVRPCLDEIISYIKTVLPKARHGFNYFPEGVTFKEKGKPDSTIYVYAWVRHIVNKNRFADWTIGHTDIGCALMIALLHCLRDLEKNVK